MKTELEKVHPDVKEAYNMIMQDFETYRELMEEILENTIDVKRIEDSLKALDSVIAKSKELSEALETYRRPRP